MFCGDELMAAPLPKPGTPFDDPQWRAMFEDWQRRMGGFNDIKVEKVDATHVKLTLTTAGVANLTKDGSDLVSALTDESSNARHFSQATGANKPLWVASGVNGKASIRSTDGLRGLDQATTTAAGLEECGLQGSTADFYFGHAMDDTYADAAYNIVTADSSAPHFWMYVWTAGGYTLYKDGNVEASGSHQNVSGAGPTDSGVIFMGCDLTGGGPNTFGRFFFKDLTNGDGTAFNRDAHDRGVTGDISILGVRAGGAASGASPSTAWRPGGGRTCTRSKPSSSAHCAMTVMGRIRS
jgi:hypothetical protein